MTFHYYKYVKKKKKKRKKQQQALGCFTCTNFNGKYIIKARFSAGVNQAQ